MRGLKTTMGDVTLSAAAVAALLFLHAPLVEAHARWDLNGVVKPRTNSTGLKTDPCGGAVRTTTPATFAAGQTLEVTFEETVNHPGHFRIAFSPAGDVGFNTSVLLDNIPDTMGLETPLPHLFRTTITLPTKPCDACTLQLIQVMTDSNSNYYSCSDIKLVTGSVITPTPTPIPTPAPTDPKLIAQNLLDDFAVADADKSGTLTLAEAQMILPGLALDIFTGLDSNHDGTLSKDELNAVINPPATTPTPTPTPTNNTSSGTSDTKPQPSAAAASMEWTALLAMLPFALRRRRKSRDLSVRS